jgi:hypothetical protein
VLAGDTISVSRGRDWRETRSLTGRVTFIPIANQRGAIAEVTITG